MEEKKVKLSTVIIFLLLIVIIAGGMYIYVLRTRNIEISNRLSKEQNKSAENSNNQIKEINKKLTTDTTINKEEKINENEYIEKFNKSVSKELGNDNMIYVQLSSIDYNGRNGYISVNNKNEAEIMLEDEYSTPKKIADNVVNVWHCEQGQAPGNSYIIFLKEDGTVTYVRFRTDSSTGNKTVFESDEKTLKGITNISNIITIEGNDENGIGGIGVLFIKSDGTCLPYSTLDDLTKE